MEAKKTKFSPEQESAINTRDRTLLVSAAAGSGKTTTLTERIIRSLLDSEHPESIQNMLIVTFTNASVADLKEKIGKALRNAVNENPENKRLENELRSLEHAKIMTIDSFCAELVRANAERLGITPAYRISESAEMLILERSVLGALIDAAYEGELAPRVTPEKFEVLCDALTGVKNTSSLIDILIFLYEKTKSSVRGIGIFEDFANNYLHFSTLPPEKTPFGSYLIDMTNERLSHLASLASHYADPLLCGESPSEIALGEQILKISSALKRITEISEGYGRVREEIFAFEFPKAPTFKGEKPPAVIRAIAYRDSIKDMLARQKKNLFSYTVEEWQTLYRELSECVGTLSEFLKIFSSTYFEDKRRRGSLEFADIERLAYECLYRDGELTDVALSYRELLSAVYIDEYQDVNELQNKIFEAVSPPRARFMVGDIKQSIYGFRSAKPEIFADMKKSFPTLSQEYSPTASIFMSNNYRCDEGIVDFVNAVFDRLFGICADSIGYVKEDELRYSKDYKELTPEYEKCKICLVCHTEDGEDTAEDEESEGDAAIVDESTDAPVFIAKKIKELITSGKRRDGSPIKAGDIAVILRTKKRFSEYEAAIKAEGIAAEAAEDKDFFLNKEILLTLSLLNSIDNPRKDIYLASLMCSPLYKFTPDELYMIRSSTSEGCLYDSLKAYSERKPEFTKLSDFLNTLGHYRLLSEGMNIDLLLTRLYRESGLLALASRQGGKENLLKLYSYARKFEASSYKGLYSFIAYINNVIEKGATIDKKESAETGADAVHIGTIHSAKGLEFPVVFLADATNTIVNLDTREKIAFDEDFGISFLLRAPGGLALVDNPIHHIIHDYMDKKFFEEICRLLYVALTRPKEKLFVVGAVKEDPAEYLERMEFVSKTLTPYSLRKLKSYMDMILASSADADVLVIEGEVSPTKAEDSGTHTEHKQTLPLLADEGIEETKITAADMRERFSFSYPALHLTQLPEKMSVSRLYPTVLDGTDEETVDIDFEQSTERKAPVPAFISGTPADVSAKRGIATHNFLQFFNLEDLCKDGVDAELARLIGDGFLSKKTAELVRIDELRLFMKSELLDAMRGAARLYREFRFNTRLPAELFTDDEEKRRLYKGHTVLVQGVIDCLIEDADGSLRLIDYKTDRLTKEELECEELAREKLCKKHSLQLSYYALAVEKIFGKKPTRVEVYSLPLGKTVDVSVR